MVEPAAAKHNEAGALTALAYEHCMFPMVEMEHLREGDLQIATEGRGVEITDIEGRTFLDMVSGHARANSLGYGNAEVARAVAKTMKCFEKGAILKSSEAIRALGCDELIFSPATAGLEELERLLDTLG